MYKSLCHTKWDCKYIVFIPEYRQKVPLRLLRIKGKREIIKSKVSGPEVPTTHQEENKKPNQLSIFEVEDTENK